MENYLISINLIGKSTRSNCIHIYMVVIIKSVIVLEEQEIIIIIYVK